MARTWSPRGDIAHVTTVVRLIRITHLDAAGITHIPGCHVSRDFARDLPGNIAGHLSGHLSWNVARNVADDSLNIAPDIIVRLYGSLRSSVIIAVISGISAYFSRIQDLDSASSGIG
jgi:hypothetical protein